MKSKGRFRLVTVATATLLLLGMVIGSFFIRQVTHAASYCQVTYTVTNQWSGGFGATISVQNTSTVAWTSWSLAFAFPVSGQRVTQGWNGTFAQSGQNVTVTNVSWNGAVSINGSVSSGFNGIWTGSNPIPSSFAVNGNACNGSIGITPTSATTPTAGITPTPGTGYTGNATWYSGIGGNAYLDSQNFIALNVQDTPGNYSTFLPRPIPSQSASQIGQFNNGLNCGRWVQVTIGDYCTGVNDGAPNQPFCRNGNWVADKYSGATLNMLVADSCQDGNAWCRDDPYHIDLSQNSLNLFVKDGQPVGDMYPKAWNNRHVNWQFIPAPNYSGDIQIAFLQGANPYWSAISINHLANGIHGVDYYQNGNWIKAPMDSDMGNDYVVLPTVAGGSSYQIRVRDVTDQPINNGRIYNFSYPASCGSSCSAPYLPISYTTS